MNSYQFISQKVSPISKLIDKQIFANGLCITDSGCDDWAVNSSPFDDEGVATRTTQLFQNGYYKNSISDCETVEKYHVYPTGNARKKNGFTKVGDILKCSGNVFELLGYIDQLSTDKSIAKGNMYLPYALINNFSFK